MRESDLANVWQSGAWRQLPPGLQGLGSGLRRPDGVQSSLCVPWSLHNRLLAEPEPLLPPAGWGLRTS